MLSTVRRSLAALAAAPVLAVALVGCGENLEQSQVWYNAGDGSSAEAGTIAVRNAFVVSNESGDRATVLATFANYGEEADELLRVKVGETEAQPSGTVTIPAGGYAQIGPGVVGSGTSRVDIQGADTVPGQFVDIEFTFATGPRVALEALVQLNDGVYAGALSG